MPRPRPALGKEQVPTYYLDGGRVVHFRAEHVQAMHRAFEAVCVTLQLSMASDDKVTELVGEKIIELARAGERNPDRLTARVLAEFGIENDGSLWRH